MLDLTARGVDEESVLAWRTGWMDGCNPNPFRTFLYLCTRDFLLCA